jgi:glucose/arabinose dehydrogenase/cytochrome c2
MIRSSVIARLALLLLSVALPEIVLAANVAAGRALFRQQCTICHTAEANDNGGAQGPALIGVFGRSAASLTAFTYSPALRDSKLTWDEATLDKFLSAPTTLVPGTAMVVAIPAKADRDNVIAYFKSKARKPGTMVDAAPVIPIPEVSERSADWKKDVPGKQHRILLNALRAPFNTPSVRNNPKLVARPAQAALMTLPGFKIDEFASGFNGPRKMLIAANGDILVSEMSGGRVTILHPTADGRAVAATDVYLQGLKQPFGLAFYPNADHPQWLYVGETNRVVRYPYQTGDVKPRGEAEVVVADLPTGGHSTRDIAFSPDGQRLFVSVGSSSNVAEKMTRKTPDEIKAWEAEHGLGAAWDFETNRAVVLVFDAHAPSSPKIFASGVRNCVSLTVQPANGSLWCTTNERDMLGDDLVPDYSTHLQEGGFYGWPWYYLGDHEDPRLTGDRPDLKGKAIVPDILYQAHSASLNLTFYTASTGGSAFPAEYVGDAFVAFHGSWNRSLRTGYKLVRVRMKDNLPTGEYVDFVTGFVVDNGDVWGRPVATTQLKDGSLLMSDDGSNVIYRITYSTAGVAP